MDFALSSEQEALRQSARRFLAQRGRDPEVFGAMARELGWTALAIPEAFGGAGLGAVELAVLMEELGRALSAGPFFSTVCLGAGAILAAGSDAQKREHLPGIAAGEAIATLAWHDAGAEAEAVREGADLVLTGKKSFVPDGHVADLVVVTARFERETALFVVPAGAKGVERRRVPTLDQTRPQAELVLDRVRLPASARLVGSGPAALCAVRDLACIALAAEMVGGAERCLEMACDYAKTRVQFGRPIGSFQAIKHKLADMLLSLESARSAALWAAWTAAEEPGSDELPIAASLAKATSADTFFQCAGENIQIHGGIGFTWEHDAHLYFKRAQADKVLLGDPAWHRERIARRVLGGEVRMPEPDHLLRWSDQ